MSWYNRVNLRNLCPQFFPKQSDETLIELGENTESVIGEHNDNEESDDVSSNSETHNKHADDKSWKTWLSEDNYRRTKGIILIALVSLPGVGLGIAALVTANSSRSTSTTMGSTSTTTEPQTTTPTELQTTTPNTNISCVKPTNQSDCITRYHYSSALTLNCSTTTGLNNVNDVKNATIAIMQEYNIKANITHIGYENDAMTVDICFEDTNLPFQERINELEFLNEKLNKFNQTSTIDCNKKVSLMDHNHGWTGECWGHN